MDNGFYHDGSRALQDTFDTRRLADRLVERVVSDSIDERSARFIERSDCFFLATADDEGRPTVSYKGGDPGFVRVVDQKTLAFPSYDGNGMFLSAGNIVRNHHVGLLFIDFERANRIRLQGQATVSRDDPLIATFPGAQIIMRVAVEAVFPNCPRYIHKRTLVERSEFVPREGCTPPVPDWKRSDLARDVLPAGDPSCDLADPD